MAVFQNFIAIKRFACWATIAVLAGCSSTNPYQRSKLVDTPILKLAKDAVKEQEAEPLAGNLHGAIMALKDQRNEWYSSLSAQARVRAVTQFGLLGLTAITVYSGLKSGVASDGDKKRLALGGALGLAAYGASTWFVNPNQEKAYLDGMHGLTCAILLIEPFRFGSPTFALMEGEQKTLTAAINALDESLRSAEAIFYYPRDAKSTQARVRNEARKAISRGEKTRISSYQLYREIENSGITLMREGDLVFSRVAASINAANKAVTEPDPAKAVAILSKFRAVKIDAEEAASVPTGQVGPTDLPDTTEPGDKTAKGKVARTAGAEQVTATEQGKKMGDATSEELAAQLELRRQQDLDDLKASLKKAQAEAKAVRNEAVLAKTVVNAATIKTIFDACIAAKRTDCNIPLTADKTATDLASQTAALYAARRPLSDRLIAFNQARKSAEKNRACAATGSPMTVSPSADANIARGATYPIVISGVVSPPSVNLTGDATFNYTVGPGVNQFTYNLIADADAKGEIDLVISDRGLATEEIKLTVADKK